MKTQEVAKGRWGAILVAFGIPAKILDGKHHPCPIPGCGGRDRFRFDDREGTGSYICGQCGAGHGFKLLQRIRGWEFRQAAREVDKILGNLPASRPIVQRKRMTREDVALMWKLARLVLIDDPIDAYLRGRGIGLASWPKPLRYAANMWHAPSKKYLPCMLAHFQSADGKSDTLHRTYLGEVEPRRMHVPFGIPKGGAIRLGDPDLAMGIAEGIETALSASLIFRMPVWATTSEALLRAWQPPSSARHITIFGDNDSSFVGQRASYELAWRLAREGLRVSVQIPMTPDWDWNDVLKDQPNVRGRSDMSELRIHDHDAQPIPRT